MVFTLHACLHGISEITQHGAYSTAWPLIRPYWNKSSLFKESVKFYEESVKSYEKSMKSYEFLTAAAATESLQSCLTLCDPRDSSPSGSPIPGILQARILEWVAISFSNAWKWKVKVNSLSRVWLVATPWIAAYQAPPSMGFSRQEYWSGVPLPSPILCTKTLLLIFCRKLLNQ